MDIYAELAKLVEKKVKKGTDIKPEDELKDLGLDSLDKADIMISIEDLFNISFEEDEMLSVKTVEDLKVLIEKKIS